MPDRTDFTPSAATLAEYGPREIPWDWPEVVGLYVGGCVEGGKGSSFRRQAHAHCFAGDEYRGWICVRSHRRIFGQTRNPDGSWSQTEKPSRLMWHEYAHIVTGHGHDDVWRAKMKEFGQPIPSHVKKRQR